MKIFNGAPGFGHKMSEREITAFLCSGKMNLQFGSIDDKNEPNVHPVWYVYENERFYFATESKSCKIQNIKQNKIVYFSVSNEEEPFIGVRGKAKPRISEDKNLNSKIAKKIITKYLGGKKSELANEIMDEITHGLEVVVEVKPEYFAAWRFES